jgi:hypothetical protein
MVRGPKKHMKRLNAPKHWMLSKMGGIWAPKPAPGPHKQRECLPLSLILRNRLKYALSRKEALMVVMQKQVLVDGKVRTELNYPAGFMGESSPCVCQRRFGRMHKQCLMPRCAMCSLTLFYHSRFFIRPTFFPNSLFSFVLSRRC